MGSTNKEGNARRSSQSTTADSEPLEKHVRQERVGDAITATDIDSTTLGLQLEGPDADSFDIDHSTGPR